MDITKKKAMMFKSKREVLKFLKRVKQTNSLADISRYGEKYTITYSNPILRLTYWLVEEKEKDVHVWNSNPSNIR